MVVLKIQGDVRNALAGDDARRLWREKCQAGNITAIRIQAQWICVIAMQQSGGMQRLLGLQNMAARASRLGELLVEKIEDIRASG